MWQPDESLVAELNASLMNSVSVLLKTDTTSVTFSGLDSLVFLNFIIEILFKFMGTGHT